jgi:hypothetical protein
MADPPKIDLSNAAAYQLVASWPEGNERSDAFLVIMAGAFSADRPDLAERLLRFADEYRDPDTSTMPDGIIDADAALSALAAHYPAELSARTKGSIIEGDMVRFLAVRSPAASAKNDALREFIRLNGGKTLGAEAIRKKLAPTMG